MSIPVTSKASSSITSEPPSYVEYVVRALIDRVSQVAHKVWPETSSNKPFMPQKKQEFLRILHQALKYGIVDGGVMYEQFLCLVPSEVKSELFRKAAADHSSLRDRLGDYLSSKKCVQERRYQRGDKWVREHPQCVESALQEALGKLMV